MVQLCTRARRIFDWGTGTHVPPICAALLSSCPAQSARPYWQVLNLKDASRVLQEKVPLVLMYSWAYQNVQSSLGSIAMLL